MKAILAFAPLFSRLKGALALTLGLSLLTVLAGIGLLGSSGWFLTAAALTTRQRPARVGPSGAICPAWTWNTASTREPLPARRTVTRSVCGRPEPDVSWIADTELSCRSRRMPWKPSAETAAATLSKARFTGTRGKLADTR